MKLPLIWSLVLVVTGLWNLFIWPQFFKRINSDERARDAAGKVTVFWRVHAIIIGISLLLGLIVGVLGVWTLFG